MLEKSKLNFNKAIISAKLFIGKKAIILLVSALLLLYIEKVKYVINFVKKIFQSCTNTDLSIVTSSKKLFDTDNSTKGDTQASYEFSTQHKKKIVDLLKFEIEYFKEPQLFDIKIISDKRYGSKITLYYLIDENNFSSEESRLGITGKTKKNPKPVFNANKAREACKELALEEVKKLVKQNSASGKKLIIKDNCSVVIDHNKSQTVLGTRIPAEVPLKIVSLTFSIS